MIAAGAVPRGPLLPPQRHPHRTCRRCASAARTSRCWSSTSSSDIGRDNGSRPLVVAGGDEGARRVPVAGQRARAGERHRAARRDRPRRTSIRAEDLPDRDPDAAQHRRSGRSASAAGRWPTICTSAWSTTSESFWTAVYPLYMEREITRGNVRELVSKGPRGSARQLQDRRAALQHGAARLQAVPELPAEARLPDAVQGVPVGAAPDSRASARPAGGMLGLLRARLPDPRRSPVMRKSAAVAHPPSRACRGVRRRL